MTIELRVEPLTAAAFARFGDVVTAEGARHFPINDGMAERYHDLARLELLGDGAYPLVNIFRGQPWRFPLEIKMVERHPQGSQCFVPMSPKPFLVVVAEGGGAEPGALHAFLTRSGEGVNYRAGVWHHPLITLDAAQDFLVIDRAGPGANLDEHHFAVPFAVIAAPTLR